MPNCRKNAGWPIDIKEVEKLYVQFKNMAEESRFIDEGHSLACQVIADNYNAILNKYKNKQ